MSSESELEEYWKMVFSLPEQPHPCDVCGHETTNTRAGRPICGYEDEDNLGCSEVWNERQIRATWIHEESEDYPVADRAADYGYDHYRQELYNDYKSYINSYDWQVKADIMKRKALGCCQQCKRGSPKNKLHVHHRHYKTLYHERVSDLEVLCEDCHAKRHGK